MLMRNIAVSWQNCLYVLQ